MVCVADPECRGGYSDRHELIDFALLAAKRANDIDLSYLCEQRAGSPESHLLRVWPGEHYRLLAGLVSVIAEQNGSCDVVEVGTYRGAGSLALLHGDKSRVVTYDIVPWEQFPETMLLPDDFGPRLEQRIGDVSDPAYLATQLTTLKAADLVFVDAPKDGIFEYQFRDLVIPHLTAGTYVVFDDIRFLNMVDLWQSLNYSALDLTSFGHHSGTGLVRV